VSDKLTVNSLAHRYVDSPFTAKMCQNKISYHHTCVIAYRKSISFVKLETQCHFIMHIIGTTQITKYYYVHKTILEIIYNNNCNRHYLGALW